MGYANGKVILVSTVRDMLGSQGWSLYRSFNNEYIFRDTEGDLLAVPQHPTKPHLIYLDELLECTHILREEFIQVARPEWDISRGKDLHNQIHFNLWLDPGNAGVSDIQALFSALSELNRAAGGFGLTFQEYEAEVAAS